MQNESGIYLLWTQLSHLLLSSLGLGLVLAVLTGFVLLCTKSGKSAQRYCLLVTLLGLFTFGLGLLVYREFTVGSFVDVASVSVNFPLASTLINVVTQINGFISKNARMCALIWLIVVAIKSFGLVINMIKLEGLKRLQVFPAGIYWEERITQLASRIGLFAPIRILQSGIIQVPMVIGHLKPVILIPFGMISAMSPEEIELILLHELAHIRRMDFLVNLFQHLLEIVCFFNPAVLWVSALIRKERENCCDDQVIHLTASKQDYIQALLSFRLYQSGVPVYAQALIRENNLIKRIRRLASHQNAGMNIFEKGILLLLVALLIAFSLSQSGRVLSIRKPDNYRMVVNTASVESASPFSFAKTVLQYKKRENTIQSVTFPHALTPVVRKRDHEDFEAHRSQRIRDQAGYKAQSLQRTRDLKNSSARVQSSG